MSLLFKSFIIALIKASLIYSFILFIGSIFKYLKFRNITNRIFEESNARSNNLNLESCQINGCLCKEIKICDSEEFIRFIDSYVGKHGIIHMLSVENDIFFNVLENHLLREYCIIIGGIAIMPKSYIDFINILMYLSFCDNISYHINNNSKHSESWKIYINYILIL